MKLQIVSPNIYRKFDAGNPCWVQDYKSFLCDGSTSGIKKATIKGTGSVVSLLSPVMASPLRHLRIAGPEVCRLLSE